MTSQTSIHFSHRRDDWQTPPDLYAQLDSEYGPFSLDAAASADNALAPEFYDAANSALDSPWRGRVFCNPPYPKIEAFIEHAIREMLAGHPEAIVMLVPARTDTIWFREAFEYADEIHFLSGRIRFRGAMEPAPFPSAIIVFRPRRERTWSSNGGVRYTMPKRHGTRPATYTLTNRRNQL